MVTRAAPPIARPPWCGEFSAGDRVEGWRFCENSRVGLSFWICYAISVGFLAIAWWQLQRSETKFRNAGRGRVTSSGLLLSSISAVVLLAFTLVFFYSSWRPQSVMVAIVIAGVCLLMSICGGIMTVVGTIRITPFAIIAALILASDWGVFFLGLTLSGVD
jgi:hypothetical protein